GDAGLGVVGGLGRRAHPGDGRRLVVAGRVGREPGGRGVLGRVVRRGRLIHVRGGGAGRLGGRRIDGGRFARVIRWFVGRHGRVARGGARLGTGRLSGGGRLGGGRLSGGARLGGGRVA